MMKLTSTQFARGVVYLFVLTGLAVCVVLLPELAREEGVSLPLWIYVIISPFFVSMYQTIKLLNHIDAGQAFSHQSLTAVRNIKICTIIFGLLVLISDIAGIISIRSMNPHEDVTFMFALGAIFAFISGTIAIFLALLQRVLQDAITLKAENDFIV